MKEQLIELYKTFKQDYTDGDSFAIKFSYDELPGVNFELKMEEVQMNLQLEDKENE